MIWVNKLWVLTIFRLSILSLTLLLTAQLFAQPRKLSELKVYLPISYKVRLCYEHLKLSLLLWNSNFSFLFLDFLEHHQKDQKRTLCSKMHQTMFSKTVSSGTWILTYDDVFMHQTFRNFIFLVFSIVIGVGQVFNRLDWLENTKKCWSTRWIWFDSKIEYLNRTFENE